MAKPCSVDDCTKQAHAKGLCPMHYQRLRTRGDVGGGAMERQTQRGLVCEVEGCGQPRRKTGWCASHYSQFQRLGEVRPFQYKWSDAVVCKACGEPTGGSAVGREFCSWRCRGLWDFHDGVIPTYYQCVGCDRVFGLERQEGRYRMRSDRRICPDCRQGLRRHGMTVRRLADRDGALCRLCGDGVALDLKVPRYGAPTVDHILPRAHGGKNDPENLQLAHFLCNSRRKHKLMAEVMI